MIYSSYDLNSKSIIQIQNFIYSVRDCFLYAVEFCTLVILLYRWSIGPDDVISEFLYKDAFERSILTFYVLIHLFVIFYDLCEFSDWIAQVGKLGIIVSAGAWITLIAFNNHEESKIHNVGVVVYVLTSIILMLCISLMQDRFLAKIFTWFFLVIGSIFAVEYLYLFFLHNPSTWLAQHRAFLTMMIGFALTVHIPPSKAQIHEERNSTLTKPSIGYGSTSISGLCEKKSGLIGSKSAEKQILRSNSSQHDCGEFSQTSEQPNTTGFRTNHGSHSGNKEEPLSPTPTPFIPVRVTRNAPQPS